VPWAIPLITLEEGIARAGEVDVVFLCLPHGESITAAQRFIAAGVMVIDLSADFRLERSDAYRRWYGKEHSAPALLDDFIYGLCEVNRAQLRGARRIANPGCYPTGVNLGLYPLAKAGWLGDRVIVDSKSSVSGAGRTAKLPYLFVEVNENMSPYSIGYRHRHIAEMELVLHTAAQPGALHLFAPSAAAQPRHPEHDVRHRAGGRHRGNMRALYAATYAGEPFIHLLPAGQLATLRHVTHSNRCAISITPADPDDAGRSRLHHRRHAGQPGQGRQRPGDSMFQYRSGSA
jgi:N-acetyl-gamma-glutamyl-phosphate reductase